MYSKSFMIVFCAGSSWWFPELWEIISSSIISDRVKSFYIKNAEIKVLQFMALLLIVWVSVFDQSLRPSPLLWAPPTGCHRLTWWTLGWGSCRKGDSNIFCASSAPWPIMNDMRGVVLHIIMFSPEVGPVIIPVLQRRMLRFRKRMQLVEGHAADLGIQAVWLHSP